MVQIEALTEEKDTLIAELSALLDSLCGLCEPYSEELSIGHCQDCGLPICQFHSEYVDGNLLCTTCEPI